MTGRMRAPAKSVSLRKENLTVVYVSLLFVLCTSFCKDAPKMQNRITGRIPAAAKSIIAEEKSHCSICLFPCCAFHKILQRRAGNVKPYNRTHIGTRQECVFAEGKSHRSICLFTFCALHKFLRRRAKNVKPYNRTHTGTRPECVFAEGKSHRSICLFTVCALHEILQRRAENVKPYNRTQAACRQECVFERVKFGRVIAFYMLFTRAQSAADADTSVTRTALSDSTPLT